ncbi:MAG: hypothetical protein M1816_004615 [Peltula sp. TS41687]|nr:MAG: hypothetical protein M1816_004615 [Peltula sp. TS41687]
MDDGTADAARRFSLDALHTSAPVVLFTLSASRGQKGSIHFKHLSQTALYILSMLVAVQSQPTQLYQGPISLYHVSNMKKPPLHASRPRSFFDRLLIHDRPADMILSCLWTTDLLSLRLTSRAAARLVDRVLPRLFETLYAKPLLGVGPDVFHGLGSLQHYCKELLIQYPRPTDPILAAGESSSVYTPESNEECTQPNAARARRHHGVQAEIAASSSAQPVSIILIQDPTSYWRSIFAQLPNLTMLTISCPGQPPWPGYQAVERSLVGIRQALESTTLPSVTSLRLDPIHAIGILHLRWAGLAAFESAEWMAGPFWSRIRTLDISLLNPAGLLAKGHQRMFVKILHDYLGSFSGFLEDLRFRWVGASLGPNPLFLEQAMAKARRRSSNGVSDFSAPALRWGSALKMITLQRCDCDVMHVKALFEERAPGLQEFKVRGDIQGPLESLASVGYRWRKEVDFNDTLTWIFGRVPGTYQVLEDYDINQDWPARDEEGEDDDEDDDDEEGWSSDGEEDDGEIPIFFAG